MATKRNAKLASAPALDSQAYEGNEAWTNKRFAWEFLCRNDEFREACDSLEDAASAKEKQILARRFGLVRFKHYGEPYESADDGIRPPVFRSRAVQIIGPKRQNNNDRAPLRLEAGQFLVRFDLKFALQDDTILKAQLKSAESGLRRHLNARRRAIGETAKSGRNRPRARLLEQLKILDALAISTMTHSQRANLLFGETDEKKFIERMDAAKEMSKDGYLLLAALGSTQPTSKG